MGSIDFTTETGLPAVENNSAHRLVKNLTTIEKIASLISPILNPIVSNKLIGLPFDDGTNQYVLVPRSTSDMEYANVTHIVQQDRAYVTFAPEDGGNQNWTQENVFFSSQNNDILFKIAFSRFFSIF